MVDIRYLSDYLRKRARAQTHLDAIDQAIKTFTKREPDLVPGKLNVDGDQYVFEFPRVYPDPGLAPIIGDFVYDMRACLDYLITALCRRAGNDATDSTEFPIYSGAKLPKKVASILDLPIWWDNDPDGAIAKKIRGAPPNTKAVLKPLQPFYGVPAVDPDDHPLAHLQALSNRDKHRSPNLLANRVAMTFTDSEGNPVFDQPAPHGTARVSEASEGDTQVLILNGYPEPHVDVYLRTAYDIRFDDMGPASNLSVMDTLTRISKYINGRVVPTVARLL
jgi:hypothetical protein